MGYLIFIHQISLKKIHLLSTLFSNIHCVYKEYSTYVENLVEALNGGEITAANRAGSSHKKKADTLHGGEITAAKRVSRQSQ